MKTQQILNFPQPTNKEELVRFIGMVNYFRRFIPHFTQTIWNLENEKNMKSKSIEWTQEMQDDFEEVKKKLATAVSATKPVYDDVDRPFHLYTDASIRGLGWCLAQPTEVQEDGVRYIRPILFNSRRLSKAEVNYGTTEQECLGFVEGTKDCSVYLWGRPFRAYTDH